MPVAVSTSISVCAEVAALQTCSVTDVAHVLQASQEAARDVPESPAGE